MNVFTEELSKLLAAYTKQLASSVSDGTLLVSLIQCSSTKQYHPYQHHRTEPHTINFSEGIFCQDLCSLSVSFRQPLVHLSKFCNQLLLKHDKYSSCAAIGSFSSGQWLGKIVLLAANLVKTFIKVSNLKVLNTRTNTLP